MPAFARRRRLSYRILAAALAVIVASLALAPQASAATNPPSTSPAPYARINVGGDINAGQCSTGFLCAFVVDYSQFSQPWIEFKFYTCQTYYLFYWHDNSITGNSYVIDDQTGGVTSRFYGSSGNLLWSYTPHPGVIQEVPNGWNPYYSIKSC